MRESHAAVGKVIGAVRDNSNDFMFFNSHLPRRFLKGIRMGICDGNMKVVNVDSLDFSGSPQRMEARKRRDPAHASQVSAFDLSV